MINETQEELLKELHNRILDSFNLAKILQDQIKDLVNEIEAIGETLDEFVHEI